jgi:hypothetical protein
MKVVLLNDETHAIYDIKEDDVRLQQVNWDKNGLTDIFISKEEILRLADEIRQDKVEK